LASAPQHDDPASLDMEPRPEDVTTFLDFSAASEVDVDCSHYLLVGSPGTTERLVELGPHPIVIGRSRRVDLCIPDGTASKAHCEVRLVGDQVLVTDLQSRNGTFIDGQRVEGSMPLPAESVLGVGKHRLRHVYRSRQEIAEAQARSDDLRRAQDYMHALLPSRIENDSLSADWCYLPSAALGGDGFGYYMLDADTFVVFLLDVSGHGTGPALHSASAVNVLNQQSLPGANFARPEEVLLGLNRFLPMEEHDDLYFTMWYGAYSMGKRELTYASAGHPPAFLVKPDRSSVRELQTMNYAVGMFREAEYHSASLIVEPNSTLYLYSDGAYEIDSRGTSAWSLAELKEVVARPREPGLGEAARVERVVRARTGRDTYDDDFSVVAVTLR